jgi:hypothetical protein
VQDKFAWIHDYSWADAGAKVKVYVPCEGLGDLADSQVSANFEKDSVVLQIAASPRKKLQLQKLNAEINTEESKVKVETSKGRITLVLVKNQQQSSWHSLVRGVK